MGTGIALPGSPGRLLEAGEKTWHGSSDTDRKIEEIEEKFKDLYAEAADQIYIKQYRDHKWHGDEHNREKTLKPVMTRSETEPPSQSSFTLKFRNMNRARKFP